MSTISKTKNAKHSFVCQSCGAELSKWQGCCPDCSQWNTIVESLTSAPKPAAVQFGYAGPTTAIMQPLSEVDLEPVERISTQMSEFDRVLGGGIVPGSVTLLGGDPGIGKSSILLQVLCALSSKHTVLYVTGEESVAQVAMRARRMHCFTDRLQCLPATDVNLICQMAEKLKPEVIVIDSIQTMMVAEIASASGSVSQVREGAAAMTRFAKGTNTAVFLVGHVTKTGEVAGPRVLEHIVDTVLLIEGNRDSRFRVMRALKNRFGAVNELGVFAMTEKGMQEVKNPSAIFLSRAEDDSPGSVVMIIWEGSRPILIEIQALLDTCQFGQPRRVAVGVDQNRLALLLAILHRHAGVQVADQDVFINVVGGVKVSETSADLALLCAIVSSLKNKALPKDLIIFGEVGLAGEIRPVASGIERIEEASKHGFKKAIVPYANQAKEGKKKSGIEVHGVKRLRDALDILFNL